MLIKRNQQTVWIHTERDAQRAPRNPHHTGHTDHPERRIQRHQQGRHNQGRQLPDTAASAVIQAKRPIQTDLGRCLAIRLLHLPAGQELQVLVASPNRATTWFEAEKALTQRQAESWARWGF